MYRKFVLMHKNIKSLERSPHWLWLMVNNRWAVWRHGHRTLWQGVNRALWHHWHWTLWHDWYWTLRRWHNPGVHNRAGTGSVTGGRTEDTGRSQNIDRTGSGQRWCYRRCGAGGADGDCGWSVDCWQKECNVTTGQSGRY